MAVFRLELITDGPAGDFIPAQTGPYSTILYSEKARYFIHYMNNGLRLTCQAII